MKIKRWYEIEGDRLYIYDAPIKADAQSVSIVSLAQLAYYFNEFTRNKGWE